jgi:hypothetical protein
MAEQFSGPVYVDLMPLLKRLCNRITRKGFRTFDEVREVRDTNSGAYGTY